MRSANPGRSPRLTRAELTRRVEAIEEAYEFFLAYAAQGVSGDRESKSGGQLREYLARMVHALTDLAEGFRAVIIDERGDSAAYDAFLDVLARDAQDTLAALQVVTAQPSISSQTIDNLNASIHVRALLTDLFLLDEAARPAP